METTTVVAAVEVASVAAAQTMVEDQVSVEVGQTLVERHGEDHLTPAATTGATRTEGQRVEVKTTDGIAVTTRGPTVRSPRCGIQMPTEAVAPAAARAVATVVDGNKEQRCRDPAIARDSSLPTAGGSANGALSESKLYLTFGT